MENAKRIGCMWALAVALGIGLAVANTPAVALAAPGDSDKGSSSSESGANQPSAKKGESAATNDAPKPRRHPPKQPDETAATSSTGPAEVRPKPKKSDIVVRNRGGATSQPVIKAATRAVVAQTSAPASPANPVQPLAELATLAVTRREVASSAVDPDFITSTHGFFGLFSVTSAADPDDNHYVAFVLRTPFFTNVLTSGTDPEDNLGFGTASIGVAGHTVNTFISPFSNFSVAIPIEDPFAELFTALVRAGF
jgi:hypothetical protein